MIDGAVVFGLLASAVVIFSTTRFLASFSGWSRLSDAFPCRVEAPRPRYFGSALFRGWLGYNNCLFFSADGTGLYVLPLRLLLWGHRPIAIPWGEITGFDETSAWFKPYYRLSWRSPGGVEFAIQARVFEKLRPAAAAAGVPIVRKNS